MTSVRTDTRCVEQIKWIYYNAFALLIFFGIALYLFWWYCLVIVLRDAIRLITEPTWDLAADMLFFTAPFAFASGDQ